MKQLPPHSLTSPPSIPSPSSSFPLPTLPTLAGVLYGWGLDSGFRWGKITSEDHYPQPTAEHLHVISAAASRHSLLALTDGSVWTMGFNDSKGGGGHGSPGIDHSGQLGRMNGGNPPAPVLGELQVGVVVGMFIRYFPCRESGSPCWLNKAPLCCGSHHHC